MSRIESNFTPIDESPTDKIRFAVDLPPYLDRTTIRANFPRIGSMMKLGGIAHLRVETFEADRVSVSPTIVGHDTDGAGYAARIGSKSKTKDIEIKSSRESGSPKVDAKVKLDIQALSARIAERDLRSPQVWAHEIDVEVLKTIRTAGVKALIKDNLAHDGMLLAMIGVNSGVGVTFNHESPGETLLRLPAGYFIASATLNLLIRWPRYSGRDRYSFFIGPQLDRWGILQARTRLQHVVKADG